MKSLIDEWRHIAKGKFIFMVIIIPLVFATILGYIFQNNQLNEASVVVIDEDRSTYSQELIQKLDASQYIDVKNIYYEPIDPNQFFYNENYLGAIYLPAGLEESRYQGKQINIGFYVDQTVPMAVSSLRSGVTEVISTENMTTGVGKLVAMGLSTSQATAMISGLSLKQHLLYNPTNDPINGTVFGFVNTIFLSLIAAAVIGLVPRLRQTGELTRELENPLGLIARLIPYSIIASIGLYFSLGALKYFRTLRFDGNYIEVLLPFLIFTFNACLLSVLVGWTASSPAKAEGRIMLIVMPSFLLSGVQVPTVMLPEPMMWLSQFLPATMHFKFVRGIGMRGGELSYFVSEIGEYLMVTSLYVAIIYFLMRREARVIKKEEQSASVYHNEQENSISPVS